MSAYRGPLAGASAERVRARLVVRVDRLAEVETALADLGASFTRSA